MSILRTSPGSSSGRRPSDVLVLPPPPQLPRCFVVLVLISTPGPTALEMSDIESGSDEAIVLITGTKPIPAKKIRWFALRRFRRLGIDLKRHPDTPLKQNAAILAMHEQAEVPAAGDEADGAIVLVSGWSARKTAGVLFPEEAESARKWIAGDRPLPKLHQPFVDHVLATVAGIPDEQRETFLTPEAVERLRDGEVM